MEETIRQVIATLNDVEVKGKHNIDRMLGCILTLEKVVNLIKHAREDMAASRGTEDAKEEVAPT